MNESISARASGWPVWAPIAAMFFVNGAVYGVWATQIPLAKLRLGLDPSQLGATLFVLGLGAIAAMAASGWILQRIGAAALIRISGGVFCILLPLVGSAPSARALAGLLFFFGASGGLMDVAMNVAAAEAERRAKRPYMSSFHGMWSLAGLTGAGGGTLLLNVVSGPWQSFVMAALLAAVFVLGQARLRGEPEQRAEAAARRPALRPTLAALLVGLMAALCFSGEGAVLDWAAVYLRDSLGAAIERANLGYAAFSGAMAFGRFFGDRIRRSVDGPALVRGGCVLVFIGLLAGPLSNNFWIAVAGYLLTGLGFSNMVPVLFSAAGAMPHPETQIAAVSTLGYAGLLAAPPLFGFVAQATSLAGIFYLVAAATILIAALAGVCAPARRVSPQS
ncbi:MAG TPA: MFS transporter [Roseiarcus sp.]|nr:MFS transporter [Roseiarcus sp.]